MVRPVNRWSIVFESEWFISKLLINLARVATSDEPFALPMKLVWLITGERDILGVKRKMALERHKEVETSSKASGTRIGTQSEVLPALFNFMPCQPVVLPTENFDFTYIGVFRV
ncbi:hypothetical protein RUM44_006510 [Polyplax serrata]|uniref:Uncharacterized protein n=1 Tax=Polyplax serrata TaxID=468196 RepID=A0ABR1AJ15_POLSC